MRRWSRGEGENEMVGPASSSSLSTRTFLLLVMSRPPPTADAPVRARWTDVLSAVLPSTRTIISPTSSCPVTHIRKEADWPWSIPLSAADPPSTMYFTSQDLLLSCHRVQTSQPTRTLKAGGRATTSGSSSTARIRPRVETELSAQQMFSSNHWASLKAASEQTL